MLSQLGCAQSRFLTRSNCGAGSGVYYGDQCEYLSCFKEKGVSCRCVLLSVCCRVKLTVSQR